MSHFISPIPADGFIEIPPVSKVTPLPTNATGRCSVFLGAPSHRITTILGSWVLPCATPRSAPIPSSFILDGPRISNFIPSSLRLFVRSANSTGYNILAGSETRSRVRNTPFATAESGR